MLAETYRRPLREVALDKHALVTTDDVRALRIPPAQRRSLTHRGGLTRVAHGVYRFDDIPPSAYTETWKPCSPPAETEASEPTR